MSLGARIHVVGFTRFIAQKMDWHYFLLSLFASGMYLFNMIVVGLSHGPLRLDTSLVGVITNPLVLTIVYLTALLELMDAKILVRGVMARAKKWET